MKTTIALTALAFLALPLAMKPAAAQYFAAPGGIDNEQYAQVQPCTPCPALCLAIADMHGTRQGVSAQLSVIAALDIQG